LQVRTQAKEPQMNEDTRREEGSRVSDDASSIPQHTGAVSDATAPADHSDFVEVRSAGLRAVRENLARRKKFPPQS
jgi:hypothetical protein